MSKQVDGFEKTLEHFRKHLAHESKEVRNAILCQFIADEKKEAVTIAESNVSISSKELYQVTTEMSHVKNQIDVKKLEIEARFAMDMAKLKVEMMRLEQKLKMTMELETQTLEATHAVLETKRLSLLQVISDFKLTIKAPSSGLSCVCDCDH